VRAVNECGASDISFAKVSDPPCANYAIFPNPASSEIYISQKQGNKKENKAIRLVRILDKFGRQVMKAGFGNEVYNTTLNISNLLTGSYIVQINQGVEQETYTIIKQ